MAVCGCRCLCRRWRLLQPCHRQLCWHWCVKRQVARNRQGVARRWHRQLLCLLFQNGIDTALHGKETRPREQADIVIPSGRTRGEEGDDRTVHATVVTGDRTSIKRYLFKRSCTNDSHNEPQLRLNYNMDYNLCCQYFVKRALVRPALLSALRKSLHTRKSLH